MAESPKSTALFSERAELLDFLLEVSAATTETLDLDRLLANVASIVKRIIPYDLFAILLYSERLQGLRIRHSIGHRPEVVRNLIVPLSEGITGAAGANREPILVNDVHSDSRYLNALDAVRSELAVPMIARGKLVGVIDIQSTLPGAFSEDHRSILRLIASRIAVSIDNARLYRRVERQNRSLRTLAAAAQKFSSILALDELLRKIAESVRLLRNYDAFSVLLVDSENRTLKHRFSVRYDEHVELDNIPLGKGITGAAVETRQTIRVADTLADPRYIASHPGIRSEVAVPLVVQDRVIGVMDVESARINHFSDDHVHMLSLLAPQIAISVENARLYEEIAQRERRMEDDLKAARRVQSVLFPGEAPDIEGLEIGIRRRAAREISGDIYHFFEHSDYAMIAFGDSSGKGAAAALYGALAGGLLRTLAPRRRGPAMLLEAMNDILLERKVDAQYLTLLVLLWEARARQLTMANAGSVPPIICRGGRIIKPKIEGIPVGLLEDRAYDETSMQMEAGDVIMLVSDGIQDQHNAKREDYGRCRLNATLQRSCNLPAQSIADAIFRDLDEFAAGKPRFDDQTLVVLKVC
jgi:sigma-B regulation protein RsbU (phosphoserine phosphatase)